MEQQQRKPHPPSTLLAVRHDGWTGEKMASFCETLAGTAVVADACAAAPMGISGAYAARRRDSAQGRAPRVTVNIGNIRGFAMASE